VAKPSLISSAVVFNNEVAPASPLSAGNFAIAAGTNRLLVIWVFHERTATERSITGVTYNGVSMVKDEEILTTTGVSTRESMACFSLVAPAIGTNAVSVTYAGGSGNDFTVIGQQWDGVDQTTPVGTTDTAELLNATGGTGAQVGLTTDSESTFAFGACRNSSNPATIGWSNGTLDIPGTIGAFNVGFTFATGTNAATGALTAAMTYSDDGQTPDTVAIGIELNGSVAGGGRIMSSLAGSGGLAYHGGLAGRGGGLAGR